MSCASLTLASASFSSKVRSLSDTFTIKPLLQIHFSEPREPSFLVVLKLFFIVNEYCGYQSLSWLLLLMQNWQKNNIF